MLVASGAQLGDLAGIVVGSGPGSFTGVRVAAATAKGLTEGCGVPVWTYSSLAAAAASEGVWLPAGWSGPAGWRKVQEDREVEAPEPGTPCYVLFDARGERVYAGCFRVGSSSVDILVPPDRDAPGAKCCPRPYPKAPSSRATEHFATLRRLSGTAGVLSLPRSDCPLPRDSPASLRSCRGHP